VEHADGTIEAQVGQAIHVSPDEWVRYSAPIGRRGGSTSPSACRRSRRCHPLGGVIRISGVNLQVLPDRRLLFVGGLIRSFRQTTLHGITAPRPSARLHEKKQHHPRKSQEAAASTPLAKSRASAATRPIRRRRARASQAVANVGFGGGKTPAGPPQTGGFFFWI